MKTLSSLQIAPSIHHWIAPSALKNWRELSPWKISRDMNSSKEISWDSIISTMMISWDSPSRNGTLMRFNHYQWWFHGRKTLYKWCFNGIATSFCMPTPVPTRILCCCVPGTIASHLCDADSRWENPIGKTGDLPMKWVFCICQLTGGILEHKPLIQGTGCVIC